MKKFWLKDLLYTYGTNYFSATRVLHSTRRSGDTRLPTFTRIKSKKTCAPISGPRVSNHWQRSLKVGNEAFLVVCVYSEKSFIFFRMFL